MQKEEEDFLHFKTHVQLKSIIGKDLINDDNIAILELVKNAFDADSKKVDIKFINLKNNDDNSLVDDYHTLNTSRIIIQDNGVGMSMSDIKNKWLNIAFSEKKTNTKQHNRLMAGAKGVGRFSCDRLGEFLNLYTKKKNSSKFIKLIVDWKAFEIENDKNKEIQSINLKYEQLTDRELKKTGIQPFEQGVVLEIIKLRSLWVYPTLSPEKKIIGWDVAKFVALKKYLEKLINPNQAFIENDFGIYIDAPEFISENSELEDSERFIGKVENRIFEKLDFRSTSIESEIQENGNVIFTELRDRGRTIFWIKEKNEYRNYIENAKVAVYYLNPYSKAFFTKQTGIRPVDYGSIFLFINGFRVPPYGELGNDWLLIDQRKTQGYARFLGSREIVGRIEILDTNNLFKIVSSREGIVRNDSFKKLTEGYFMKVFRRLEKYVVDGLNWDSIPDKDKDRIADIEKKIISGETNEMDLIFSESDKIKSRRTYEAIHSIIGAKPEDVIELYINEGLISDKIAEEREISEREIERLLEDFENKKIDPHLLDQILAKKADQNKALSNQLREFSKYTTNEITTKAVLEIESYKKILEEQHKLISKLKSQLQVAQKEKEDAEKKASIAQDAIDKVQEELLETRSQNLFLKSIKSQDLTEVLNLMHHIGISTSTIQHYIKGVTYRLENNLEISNSDLKKIFSEINTEINKIYSISKFATKANFKVTTKDSSINIVSFIEQYLINIVKPFLSSQVDLIVYKSPIEEFILTFKPIELTIVLDNLVSNSKKAGATKIEVSFIPSDSFLLQLRFKDNGKGIPSDNRSKIFDYGFTTTDGSGLGLGYVKEIIEKIGGTIELNEEIPNGTEFIINLYN